MTYGVDEEKGRFLLRALLWLILICTVGEQVLYYGSMDRAALLSMAARLAPTAVVLWALHRGNWPALVLLAAGTINSIAAVSGALVQGRGGNLGDPALLLAAAGMGLQMSVFFCALRHGTVECWLNARRAVRTNRDLAVELVLFLLAVALLAADSLLL